MFYNWAPLQRRRRLESHSKKQSVDECLLSNVGDDDNDPHNNSNSTAYDTGVRLAGALKFCWLLIDLALGADTQTDRDGTQNDTKDEEPDNAANHGGDRFATGLYFNRCVAHRDGGSGLRGSGSGHVVDLFAVVIREEKVSMAVRILGL